MKAYATQSIRNVGIAGHGDTGKTQLVSSLLFTAGMTTRLGKVAEGTTVTDWDEEEIAQKNHDSNRAWPTPSGRPRPARRQRAKPKK